MPRALRVAALLRVSTTSVEQEESPENQLAYIREEIRRRQGGDEIWLDTGLSFEDELTGELVLERPGIKRLLASVEAGLIDLVATKSIARLGRDTLGMLALKRRLWDDAQVDLVALQDGYRASRDPELIFLIHADRAQHGRQEISHNVRTGMRQKALKGQWTAGMVPFGYHRTDRNHMAPHPATAPIVQEIFRLRADGTGITGIVDRLNNVLRVPAPRWWADWELRKDRLTELAATDERWAARLAATRAKYEGKRPLWGISTIPVILQNTAYYGELQYYRRFWHRSSGGKRSLVDRPDAEHIILPCPPIVDRDLWDRAHEAQLRHITRTGAGARRRYMLAGLIRCAKCGSNMNGTTITARKPGYLYYLCQQRRNNRACDAPAVRAAILEPLLIEHVQEAMAKLTRQPQGTSKSQSGAHQAAGTIRRLEADLADLRDQRRYYRDEHRRGRVFDPELDTELARITAQEKRAQRALQEVRQAEDGTRNDVARRAQMLALAAEVAAMKTPDPESLRRMLVAAVDHVVVRSARDIDIHLRFPVD